MVFKVPVLSLCCCCFSLRTGSLCIGYFTAVSSVFIVAGYTLIMLVAAVLESDDPGANQIDSSTALRIYVTYGAQLLVQATHGTIAVLLLIGTHKGISTLVGLCWRGWCVTVTLNLISIIVSASFNGFYTLPLELILCGVQVYHIVVIRSADLEIKAETAKYRSKEFNPDLESQAKNKK